MIARPRRRRAPLLPRTFATDMLLLALAAAIVLAAAVVPDRPGTDHLTGSGAPGPSGIRAEPVVKF